MCLSLRSGLWISLWEYFSLHTITFFFLESRPRGLQNNCTSAWFDHLLPCLLQNLRFFDCFQYMAIVVLSLVKWSEFADVTKKLQNFENRRVDQVDVNNYNYLENAYFVMLFPSGTPPPLPSPPMGSLRSPIYFLFDPFFCLFPLLRSLVQGYSDGIPIANSVDHVFGTGSSPSHPSRTHLSLSAHPLDALESLWFYFSCYITYISFRFFFKVRTVLGPVNFWSRDFFGFFVGSPSLLFSFDFCPH